MSAYCDEFMSVMIDPLQNVSLNFSGTYWTGSLIYINFGNGADALAWFLVKS